MSADRQLKQLVDRILRCREAEDEAKADTKEVYAELKALGYDKTAAGGLVAELRKKEKNPEKFETASTTLDLYREAYERASHAHAREEDETLSQSRPVNPAHEPTDYAAQSGDKSAATNQESGAACEVRSGTGTAVPEAGNQPGAPNASAEHASDESSATHSPETATMSLGDGDGGLSPSNGAATSGTGVTAGETATHFEPPAFLARQKTMADYRPNCLHPDNCGSSVLDHCYGCRKALEAAEQEFAA